MMTRTDHVYAMYDGTPPRQALDDARRLDEADRADPDIQAERAREMEAILEASRVKPPPRGHRIATMASIMVERAAASDACTTDDLAAAGFTQADIAELADRARRLAAHRTADRRGCRA